MRSGVARASGRSSCVGHRLLSQMPRLLSYPFSKAFGGFPFRAVRTKGMESKGLSPLGASGRAMLRFNLLFVRVLKATDTF